MNLHNLSPRLMFGAAIVGVVGAAGVFLYEQLYAEKRRSMLVKEVARLDKQMSSMRTELESLRELQKESQLRRLAKQKKRVRREPRPKGSPTAPAAAVAAAGDAVDGAALSYASDSEYFTDYQSVVGTDGEMDSEEFYDVHTDDDSEDDTLREPLTNGHVAKDVFDEDLSDKVDSPKKGSKNDT